jgi:formate dehydrogenase beta subunit
MQNGFKGVRSLGRPKGRHPDPASTRRIQALLGDSPRRPDLLVEFLHRIQDAEGCIRSGAIAALAEAMGLAQAEVYEVATFYHHFDVVADGGAAPPSLTVRVCDSLSCAMRGAAALADSLGPMLGEGVRVQRVPCIGRCAEAPAVVVDRYPVAPATADAVVEAVRRGDRTCPAPDAPGFDAYRAQGGWETLAACLRGDLQPEAVCATLDEAGLRGLGGAGFPTARKWRAVSSQPAPRLMAVNIDEGEPGTFKDRWHLERAPQQFLEGMLVAAWVTDCSDIYIYLRDEYAGLRALLERELAALPAQVAALYGAALHGAALHGAASAPHRMPAIHLRRGAGAYICGEESAMIESIEGRRGMPRLRPPYVAQVGLFGRPTLVNNPETLMWVPEILRRGAQWYASQGRRGRKGLRSFSVSGRVASPGVKVAPAGITLRELLDEHCGGMAPGHGLYAYLPGGASGGILPASLADLPLDFDTLAPHGAFIGSAAVIVLSDQDRARDAAANLMAFFRHESCGQCTPCRAGTAQAVELLRAPKWDEPLLAELSAVMRDASICGLGQAAPNTFDSVLRFFAQEVRG